MACACADGHKPRLKPLFHCLLCLTLSSKQMCMGSGLLCESYANKHICRFLIRKSMPGHEKPNQFNTAHAVTASGDGVSPVVRMVSSLYCADM